LKVVLKHETGMLKEVKKGFSWTVFFFGLFVPLIRGDLKWLAILFILQLLGGAIITVIGAWIVSFIFAFVYNKVYIKDLLEKGYKPIEAFEDVVIRYVS